MKCLFYALFFLLLVSCNRGCTYRRILESADKKLNINSTKVIIQVDKVKATTRYFYYEDNARNESVLKTRKNVDYQFDVHVLFENRPKLMYAYYNGAAEGQSAKDYLKKIIFKMNKRKDCFLIGEENDMLLYRMLEMGWPFSFYKNGDNNIFKNTSYELENEMPTKTLVIEALNKPDVTDIYHITVINDLIDVLKAQEPASEFDFKALESFPENYISQRILDSIRISENAKNTHWNNTAKNKAKKLIAQHNNNTAYGFILTSGLNDKNLYSYADSVSCLTWPEADKYHYNQYLRTRILNSQAPIDNILINKLYAKAKYIVTNYNTDSYNINQTEDVANFFLVYKKEKELDELIELLFRKDIYDRTGRFLDAIFQKRIDEFSLTQQQKIINKYKKKFEQTPDYFLMEFLKHHISCEEFNKFKNKYPKELTNIPADKCLHKNM